MFKSGSGLADGSLTSRIMVDVAIGLGVLAFIATLWGVPELARLLKAAGAGILTTGAALGAMLLMREMVDLLFPARRRRRRRAERKRQQSEALIDNQMLPLKAATPTPSVAPPMAPPQSSSPPPPTPPSPPPAARAPTVVREKVQKRTPGPYSINEVEARTVSIAAEPLPTPPFPEEWSEQLIETLEWRVFDDLCIAFWEAQGNSVIDHSKGSSEAANFFISAKNRPGIKIGIVQSRSSQANKASVIEMKNLMRMKQQSDVPIALFMYAGRISNVVSSYCQSHGIRLFGSHNINKGIRALPQDKQDELLKELIRPDYMIPTCPNCRIKMVKRKRRDTGRIFWGCLSYPECRETIEYSPYF